MSALVGLPLPTAMADSGRLQPVKSMSKSWLKRLLGTLAIFGAICAFSLYLTGTLAGALMVLGTAVVLGIAGALIT